MARFVESGARIPRRGEIGMTVSVNVGAIFCAVTDQFGWSCLAG